MPSQYPIRAVAKLTGISLDTLRAWERRYRVVTPGRSVRGRLYSDADIQRLKLLRHAVERGHAIGQVATLSDSELQELAAASSSLASPQLDGRPQAVPGELHALLDAVRAFDSKAIDQELSRLALLMRTEDLVHRVVLPLMRTSGQNWENGTFQIAHEHLVSASVRNLLGGLVRMQGHWRGAIRLLFTTPAGELHEFGILAAAMLAVANGFEVVYLGPNLPADEIIFAAGRNGAHAVVLGLVSVNDTPVVREEIARIASNLPSGAELWIGGTGAVQGTAGLTSGALLLDDLTAFERHLARLAANHS